MYSNLRKLLFGSGLGQIIQLVSISILSRLYSPGQFGMLAQVQSYATVAAILATCQLHLSIPLAKNEVEARMDVRSVLLLGIIISLIMTPLAVFGGNDYSYAVLLTLFIGFSNTLNGFLIYSGSFSKISRFYVFRALFITVIQVALAPVALVNGLVFGAVLGEGITAYYLSRVSKNSIRPRLKDFHTLRSLLSARSAFAVYGTLQELVSVTAFYAPLFFFARQFSVAVAGQYAMASRLIWAPAVLLAGSFAQILYHQCGKDQAVSKIDIRFLGLPKWWNYLILALAPVVCYLLKDVIFLSLGPQWRTAVDFLPIVAAWACAFIASTPARVVCRMTGQQKYHLWVDAGLLTAMAVLFQIAGLSSEETLVYIFLLGCVQNIAIYGIALRVVWNQRLAS